MRRAVAATLLPVVMAATIAGCGSSSPRKTPTLPPAAEPAKAPAPAVSPAGSVIPLPRGEPEGMVVDTRTGIGAVALRRPARLALFEARSGRVLRVIPVPGAARHLQLAATGAQVLVPGEDTDTLAVVELPSGRLRSTVRVGRQPHDATPAAGRYWVAEEFASSVGVVRGGRVEATLGGPVQPGGIAATDGVVAAVDVRGNRLELYDAATAHRIGALAVGQGPTHVVELARGMLAVADTRGNAVYAVAVRPTARVVGRLDLRGAPYGLAADPGRSRLWVTLTAVNQLVELSTGLRELARFPTVQQPNSVAVDGRSGSVLIAGAAADSLQLVTPRGAAG